MKMPPSAKMMTALVFVPWDPNSARTEWMSEALRMIREDVRPVLVVSGACAEVPAGSGLFTIV